MAKTPDRLFFTCAVLGAANLLLFCAGSLALLRVLGASARDAYNSPRRRLLELDEEGTRRGSRRLGGLCVGHRPWTTQKALLAMVAFSAGLRMVWAVVASHSWDPRLGVVRNKLQESARVVFYGLDLFEAAAIFSLFTILARFWAELASSARQGVMSTRPLGGGDEYRPRGTPPRLWKLIKPLQRISCLVAYGAATFGSFLQATVWAVRECYMGVADGLIEAMAFLLAAACMSVFAHYAIVELRLVPIELPTRRRRVYNIAAVTTFCASCLVIRGGILIWVANRTISVDENVAIICVLAYFLLLETAPLTVVLMYNRAIPSPANRPSSRAISGRERPSPEEEPLVGGNERHLSAEHNPFSNQTEIPRASVYR